MEWESKIWGKTRCEEQSKHYARHRLMLQSGTWCSYHWHRNRANRFIVINGVVRIVESYGWRVRSSILGRGCEAEVPSLVAHQFQVIEAGEMIEEYWPDRGGEVDANDIERLTEGGAGDVAWVRGRCGIIVNSDFATGIDLRARGIA